ncbi:MAG: hypothetical protein KatS3mg105_1683 [Gemmatales bacterium]|nr:MAG: hypothetical protein KatS3mg105_1683 [Gemmatales bacterium]
MRLAILSAGRGWHVRDLERAAMYLGHQVELVDFRRIHAFVSPAAEPELSGFDAVLVRTMPPGSLEQVVFRMNVLHRLRAKGVQVWNSPAAIEGCVDKYLASVRLEEAGLQVPKTAVCQTAETALDAFHRLGGDVVVKPLFGSEGRGMIRVTDIEIAWRTFHALERLQSIIFLQEFVPHPGYDVRAFVLGDSVLAAMTRYGRGSWRTNIAQGGQAEVRVLEPNLEKMAILAAHALGARIAGVDLLPNRNGDWFVLEVNAVPGWRKLSPVTGTDVARKLLEYLYQNDDKCRRQ